MHSLLSLVLLALPLVFAAHTPAVNHRELAKRAKGDLAQRGATGGTNARWTFYATGLGACGRHNVDSDYIVALNQGTFGFAFPSEFCFKQISMSYKGKTTTATIVDSCPGCPTDGGLDLSPGLFSFFADESEGVIYGDWSFVDGSSGGGGGGDDDAQTTTKKTTTHHTTSTTEHTTATHTTPTTTHTPPPTTTSTTKSSTVETHSSSAASVAASASARLSSSAHPVPSAPSNSPAEPSGTGSSTSPDSPQNLYAFAQAVIDLTTIVAVSGGNTD